MFQYAFPLRKTEPKIVTTTTTDYRQTTSDEHGFLRPSYTIAPSGQKYVIKKNDATNVSHSTGNECNE